MPKPIELRARNREHDRQRYAAQPWRKWYSLAIWKRIKAEQLAEHPLCARHLDLGKTVPATVVNHITPHRGDWQRFISGPFESVCKVCHDGLIKAEESRGVTIGSDKAGQPVDPAHPWNRP